MSQQDVTAANHSSLSQQYAPARCHCKMALQDNTARCPSKMSRRDVTARSHSRNAQQDARKGRNNRMSHQDVSAGCPGRMSRQDVTAGYRSGCHNKLYSMIIKIYINKECHFSMAALQRIHWNFSRSSSNETTCSSFKTLRNLVKIVFFRRCIAY